MAEIIKIDGTHQLVEPSNKKYFTLKELQTIVEGYIQIIPLDNKLSMVANEEGKLINLPYNNEASKIFLHYTGYIDLIMGNVLVTENKYLR